MPARRGATQTAMSDSHDASHDHLAGGATDAHTASAPAKPAQEDTPQRSGIRGAVALTVLIVGVVGSILGARAIANSDAASSRATFTQASANAAAAARLAISHQEDLRTAATTYLAANPDSSAAEFRNWAHWARALRDYPGVESLGVVALVRAPELSAFYDRLAGRAPATTAAATTTTGASTTSASSKTAASGPSYQCLSAGSVSRGPAVAQPSGVDYCMRDAALLGTRDTAQTLYRGISLPGGAGLEALTPVYRGSSTPITMAGRRAAFAGWLRETVSPRALLEQARQGTLLQALQLSHAGVGTTAAVTVGTAGSEAQGASASLPGGWTLRSYGPPVSTNILHDGDALALLALGLLASLEAVALVLSLGHGPSRPRQAPQQAAPPLREDLYDPLTELPNRGLTLDRAERMLARAGRNTGIMIGALFIDLDWFKDVNDKLGSEVGDQLLKTVAQRLEGVVRTHDTVGRYGGDEFVVLVESAVRGMRLDALAGRIIEALHKPVELEGFGPSFCLTASIGVAYGRYATSEDLLRDAHMALFAAKAAGKDRYTLFNANMRSIIEGRGVLEVDLNSALQDEQFSLLYQPVYELATQRVVGLEALLRWQHPTRGEVPPGEFIPLAEESGLIVPIGRWVLQEACARAAAWNVAGHRVGVAVKVAAIQFNRDGFATDVQRALQQSGLEPSMLALEIAETTVMEDREGTAGRLQTLKQLGVKIAIDDFGSGYAYRSDLQRMPIDFLKVDRSSLAASEDEDYRSWLLEAILVFGRDLSLTVIAKGVEDQEQAAALQAMGCSLAQGFHLGAPVPPESVPRLFGAPEPATAPAALDGQALGESAQNLP